MLALVPAALADRQVGRCGVEGRTRVRDVLVGAADAGTSVLGKGYSMTLTQPFKALRGSVRALAGFPFQALEFDGGREPEASSSRRASASGRSHAARSCTESERTPVRNLLA